LEKAVLNLQRQISDCIKELFMLVIALYTASFFRTKINKNLWPPYLEWSGAGTEFEVTLKKAV